MPGMDWNHRYKEARLSGLAQQMGIQVLVESGTYQGLMIKKMAPFFEQMYSIELDKELYRLACHELKGYAVKLYQGNSALVLPEILEGIQQPVIFWLDAHWSGGPTAGEKMSSPLMSELSVIAAWWKKGSAILVDDFRNLNGKEGNPYLHTLLNHISALTVFHTPNPTPDDDILEIR